MGGAAVVSAGIAGVLGYGIKGRSSQIFGRSVYRGPGRRRTIALTFDDGPSESTPEVLDVLAAEGIKATFFQCGMNAERLPEMVKRVVDAGHELGNHTYSHRRLCPRVGRRLNLVTPQEIYRELERTQEILEGIGKVRPTLFRAPYGMRWFGLGAAQRKLGLLGVMWTVIGHDWEWPAERIARLVVGRAAPGGIICLHDGRDIRPCPDISEMLAALKVIIASLKVQGYAFETVGHLLVPDAAL